MRHSGICVLDFVIGWYRLRRMWTVRSLDMRVEGRSQRPKKELYQGNGFQLYLLYLSTLAASYCMLIQSSIAQLANQTNTAERGARAEYLSSQYSSHQSWYGVAYLLETIGTRKKRAHLSKIHQQDHLVSLPTTQYDQPSGAPARTSRRPERRGKTEPHTVEVRGGAKKNP